MTTQQPTQQPEATQDPVIVRVGKLEAIAEETHLRLAENHAEHQTLSEKIDRQGESLRAEIRALSDKVDRQGEALSDKVDRQGEAHRAEINRQGEAHRAEIKTLNEKIDRQTYRIIGAFITVWAATVGAAIALFLAM